MSNSPRLLYAAAVVVPLCLLLLAGWMNYQQAESEARLRVDRSTEALSEHALRTFRAHELIIDFVNSYVDGWSWERIRSSEELHRLLAHFAARHEDIASIFLLDPGGKTWMSSRRFPMPAIDGTDRDYFQALRAGDRLHISRPARGRLSQDRFFSVARRKSSPSGAFDGVIAVSVKPEYFASFYGTLLQSRDDAVGLARNDGSVLVREPPLAVEALVIPAEAAFMREIRSGRTSGTYIARSAGDQVERLHGYKQVGDYPLFASFQLSMDAVWSAWRRATLPYAVACVLAMGLLLAGAALAAQRTRRAAAEARIAEAEAASRAKDLFIAALSHELRNPLAAISTAAEALHRQPGSVAAVQIIGRQIAQLRRMLDDLLDSARAVYGKLKLEKRRVDLRAVAEAVVAEQVQGDGAGAAVRASVHVPGGQPWVDGDPVRLKQMLDNLVENAIKYGGRRIEIVIEAAGDWVELCVRDDGEGIAPELLPRLFQPFVQGEQTLERAHGGLGLGLALVSRLAATHGGSLAAESDGPGQGSCFTLRLPRADAAPRRVELPSGTAAAGVRRLLVVDDEEDTRESLRALLALEGHEVNVAADGPAALAALSSSRPQAALLDIGLPGMDGYDLARRIRARWEDVVLIAVTGYGQPEDRERARAAGFDAHLTKPFSYDELMRTLAGIERRSQSSPLPVGACRG